MKWVRNVSLSRKALLRHKTRTGLALVGMAVGVAAVLVMVAIGESAERAVLERIEAMGRNMLVVNAARIERGGGRIGARGTTVQTLKLRDADVTLEQSSLIARVAPSQDRWMQVTNGNSAMMARIRGTTTDYRHIRNFPTQTGRYFTDEEDRAGLRLAVIGSDVRDKLFPPGVNPDGQDILIGRVPFEVIGVLVSKGVSVDGSATEDDQVIIPVRTALRRVFNVDYLKMIYLEVIDTEMLDAAEEEVAAILRDRHRLARLDRPDDFAIENQEVVKQAELAAVASFRFLTTGLGAVALVVGGVGILSIMLLSVRERRAEIGLRVAVGARRGDVWVQFLMEALALGGAGGLAGLVLGLTASWIVAASTEWQTVVTLPAVIISVASALVIGVAFGVYPAYRAASWDPIEALRTE